LFSHSKLPLKLQAQKPVAHNTSMSPVKIIGAVFDSETILLMKSSLEDAWKHLGPIEQAKTTKSVLAGRILSAAADGERDPIRLRMCALLHVAAPPLAEKH
jgi:hypothetical protein